MSFLDIQFEHLNTIMNDVRAPFSPERFSKTRLPVKVTDLSSLGTFADLPSCLDMLIYMPGPKSGLKLPQPYSCDPHVLSFLANAINFEDSLMPNWRETHYAYLTVDQRHVVPGGTHRNEGLHFDGMQGARHHPKLPACHQYVVSDRLPTEYSDKPVNATDLDENKHNWFKELGSQVPDDHPMYQANPFEVVLMSAYQLHRSPVAGPKDAGRRTFMRLDFSMKQQDRLGNTINPLMPAPWEFVERNLPAGLQEPEKSASWNSAKKF
ncbi:hypothetical protein [Sulfitobacter sp. R18_1]|uniref:hypothetical protein n=1 Tax=Sulfitobacter sp. R18_1 TaxID=2821104 RepID=UPI001ADD5595|nr:hypothetical protein [Sulfitobacter sp. R18_1]MBO9427888.1 hypothetical protein [Sulfitobacter sp. R18_1]